MKYYAFFTCVDSASSLHLKNIHILLYFISSLIAFIFELFVICERLTSMKRRLSAHFYVNDLNFEAHDF